VDARTYPRAADLTQEDVPDGASRKSILLRLIRHHREKEAVHGN
jgi:hypothetical protein